jgi:hypothetical protein
VVGGDEINPSFFSPSRFSISLTGSIKEKPDRGLAPCQTFFMHSLSYTSCRRAKAVRLPMTSATRRRDSFFPFFLNGLAAGRGASVVRSTFTKRSRGRTGPVISPEYYSKLGKIVPDIAEACFEQF